MPWKTVDGAFYYIARDAGGYGENAREPPIPSLSSSEFDQFLQNNPVK
jgi:hypothetical protein